MWYVVIIIIFLLLLCIIYALKSKIQHFTLQDITQVSTVASNKRMVYDILDAPSLVSKYPLGSTDSFLVYDTCNTVKTGTNTQDLVVSNEIYNMCLHA